MGKHLTKYRMEYRLADYTGHMTGADMAGVRQDFQKWWRAARPHVPHLSERVRAVMVVTSEPRHVSLMVSVVADAYRYILEKRDAESD